MKLKLKLEKIILSVTFVFFSSMVNGQNFNFSGELNSMWGSAAPWTDCSGDLTAGQTEFKGTLESNINESSVYIEGLVRSDEVKKENSWELNEAYVDYTTSSWSIRAGKQKNVWGKADGINITNSVFPSDATTLFKSNETLAVKAARFSLNGNSWTIDALWIPFFSATELPLKDNNPLKKVLIPETFSVNTGAQNLVLPVSTGNFETPELKVKNGEYGIKASTYLPLCDLSIYGFYGWDKKPLMNYEINGLSGIKINGEYKRMSMAGFDAAFPVKETVVRLETAFFPERYFQAASEYVIKNKETGIRQNEIMALGGIDWMPSEWTITAQYYCDAVLDKSENLQREKSYTHGTTLSISRNFLQETLELSFSGILEFYDFDNALEFKAKYSLSDEIKILTGMYAFNPGPEENGNYGAYKNFSTFYIKVQYNF